MAKRGWKFEPTGRWIRAKLGGVTVADSKNAMLLVDVGHSLVYYFPEEDVRMDLLQESDHTAESGYKGTAVHWHVKAGDKVAENAAWQYPNRKEDRPDLRGYVAFDWHAMDAWFEEEEQVIIHPRDPYKRVDTIQSSRYIRVEIDGVVVAETYRPVLLFETGLPTRYYIPRDDVRTDLLTPTDHRTGCPYKGWASYWTAHINGTDYENIVWSYPDPFRHDNIEDLMCFYNEKVDTYIDGELEEKPKTPFV